MSEEILQALMQLFAILAKQDEGVSEENKSFVKSFLHQQLNEEAVKNYFDQFISFTEDDKRKDMDSESKKKRTSVTDSIRIMKICRKINKTLTQKQKVVVFVRMVELVYADKNFSEQRMEILKTASVVFNIEKDEHASIETFILSDDSIDLDNSALLNIGESQDDFGKNSKFIPSENLHGRITILRISTENIYFLIYVGNSEVFLNGLSLKNRRIYLFASGSSIKTPSGKPIYYSDVALRFLSDDSDVAISFFADKLSYRFPNGNIGIQELSITEGTGKLVGIMGASGAGKTTLFNILSGIISPTTGNVTINSIDIHNDKDNIEGVIGFVPQDDLLIEELTVFENLYFNAKLCLNNLSKEEITTRIDLVLENLGLEKTRDLKVGSAMDKVISGGQRKRLNIGLELIREPSVLFLDEPTSGLSSRDSENVMTLLNLLTLKGKLIFVVIHQPSSDIYKMFDKIILLDNGGYLIYNGNPVEAVSYFKKLDHQINFEQGECPTCGNVNPELLFNIIEAEIVDEFGGLTGKRKVSPAEWNSFYSDYNPEIIPEIVSQPPPKSLETPSLIKQIGIYFQRDLKSKLVNTQYMIINILEAPLLAFILSFITRYVSDLESNIYIFRENDNVPSYIFVSIIVSLFIGLTVSAEEIFKDRKILKREHFLNLSWNSYLLSKMSILFIFSALQAFLFTLVGNAIMGIQGLYLDYWLMLFAVACCANLLGLNISSAFKSAVTIYILIPLIIIPQMILGGAMFDFEKLNTYIGGGHNVPFLADFMPTRWAYEGIITNQFINNRYQKPLYELERKESVLNYKQGTYVSRLIKMNDHLKKMMEKPKENLSEIEEFLHVMKIELKKEMALNEKLEFSSLHALTVQNFDRDYTDSLRDYLESLSLLYNQKLNLVYMQKDMIMSEIQEDPEKKEEFRKMKNDYFNDALSDLVRRAISKNKIIETKEGLLQIVDPVFLYPEKSLFGLRSHFYAPVKYIGDVKISTFSYNILIIWICTILLYVLLYFKALKLMIDNFNFNIISWILKRLKKEEKPI